MDANTLFFGLLIIVSLVIFLYFGKFRASAKQRERQERIDWSQSLFKKLFGSKKQDQ